MNSFLATKFLLVGIIYLLVAAVSSAAAATKQKSLCSDSSGVFLGLATDEEAWSTKAGSAEVPQDWVLTRESGNGPQHSYDGHYLQVMPDDGRTYPGRGKHLTHARELDDKENSSPFVSFLFNVNHDGEGIHTLFLRWTGGDTVGGGDSLYVVLYKKEKKGKTLVRGQQTVKPAVVPIDAGMSNFAGCCYNQVTHACPCVTEQPNSNTTCGGDMFVSRDAASKFGAQCLIGGGAMTIVKAPEWYLYAGQEEGDVMDFDSEPWDVTCEADGSNTRDSGHDFPSWVLGKGSYDLRIYAREDGTALDGIYVAGPTGRAPAVSKRYSKGESTFCVKPPVKVGKIVGLSFAGILVVALVWFASTQPGKEVLGAVLNKPAQAVRYVYVDNT